MKKLSVIILISFLVLTISCKNDNQTNDEILDSTQTTVEVDTSVNQNTSLGAEYTSNFICPNHCEGSGSEVYGTCPVCGMEYIENPDNQ